MNGEYFFFSLLPFSAMKDLSQGKWKGGGLMIEVEASRPGLELVK